MSTAQEPTEAPEATPVTDSAASATAALTDAAAAADDPATDRRRGLRRIGIAAGYAAAFALAGGLGWQLWAQHRIEAAGAAGQHAAVAYAQTLTSIDSNNVDDGFAAVLNGATGEFKDTYTKASVQLRQLLIDNRATAQGVVVDSAIQSQSGDQVVVLLMVDQRITNTARPDPRVDRSRMKMTMRKVEGRWLASRVELP